MFRSPLLRPRWAVGHVLVAVLVVAMVSLGFWQLGRLDERRARNDLIAERQSGAASPAAALFSASGPVAEADAVWRRYRVTGRFDPTHEVLVRFRVHRGLPGFEVLTPLVTDAGHAVLVNRGWVPQELGEAWPSPVAATPTDTVTVTGLAQPSEHGGVVAEPVGDGSLSIGRIDVADLGRRLPYPVASVWLQAEQVPGAATLPAALDSPELSEGPHLSYAFQWFSFSTIVGVGWVILCWRRGRRALPGPAAVMAGDAPAVPEPVT